MSRCLENLETEFSHFDDITFSDAVDSDVKRENANINGDTSMGAMLKYGSEGAKQFYNMFVLNPDHSRAHQEGDIHIHGDNQISRQKHAVVSFYAKRQSFHVGPADGRNIIELNGEPVFSPMEMKSFDVLTVGSTKLMLVALCGETFSWTAGVTNE